MKIINRAMLSAIALVFIAMNVHADVDGAGRKWAEPKAIFGSDPKLVKEIVDMEKAVEKNYNTEFLAQPDAPLKHYSDDPDVSFIDILSPGQYYGKDVRNWFNFIGPKFVGKLGLVNMHVYAKGNFGFVNMIQTYEGKRPNGNTFFWVMRQTDVVEKAKGEWKILHTHLSFAADPKTIEPETWAVDLEMTPRPQPWDRAKK